MNENREAKNLAKKGRKKDREWKKSNKRNEGGGENETKKM